jgi:N-acetylneuraminic acid mutarotase
VAFSIGDKGYMGTGTEIGATLRYDFWEYDPAADVWTQRADFSAAARSHAVGFSIGGKGYLGTGWAGMDREDFWEYDPATDTWTQKADFGGGARSGAVGFSIGGKGYVGTGVRDVFGELVSLKDFWEYDPGTDTWTRKADFQGVTRSGAVGFSIGDRGFMGTGVHLSLGLPTPLRDFWEYDPERNSWIRRADFMSGGS